MADDKERELVRKITVFTFYEYKSCSFEIN